MGLDGYHEKIPEVRILVVVFCFALQFSDLLVQGVGGLDDKDVKGFSGVGLGPRVYKF